MLSFIMAPDLKKADVANDFDFNEEVKNLVLAEDLMIYLEENILIKKREY